MGPLHNLINCWHAVVKSDFGVIWTNQNLYLRNHARIVFNAKKNGTTVLIADDMRLALVRCLDGVKFNLRKGICYAVLRWQGIGGNDIWNDFQSFTYIKTTHEGKKKQRVIFSEDFLKYLVVKGWEFTKEELDILYEQILDPDSYDPEQVFLNLLLTKQCCIELDTIDKLFNEAQEHKTAKKPKSKKESKK